MSVLNFWYVFFHVYQFHMYSPFVLHYNQLRPLTSYYVCENRDNPQSGNYLIMMWSRVDVWLQGSILKAGLWFLSPDLILENRIKFWEKSLAPNSIFDGPQFAGSLLSRPV